MIEIAIMIEGQNGLNWERWQRIAATVEACGYAGLYRSDHFTNASPPDLDSLECWTSLTWLASHTQRIEFGPLVSPLSFRHPAFLARMATAVDDLSGGRLSFGVGAGWQAREHANFGWDLLDKPRRFNRFEEGLEVISRLLKSDQPVDFSGNYYHLQEAILLPRPKRLGGPPILVGGSGEKRTLPLTAKFANEWNAPFTTAVEFKRLNFLLDKLLLAQGRSVTDVRRSLTVGCVFGSDFSEVERKVNIRTHGQRTVSDLRERGLVVGTPGEIVEQCRKLQEAGVQRLMLQWLDLEDTAGLKAMADGILGALS
ncbi:MAG: LLM class F420-dependent oxidoreductase [Anaerolineales bacterium]|nr:TIGR03560 family F420-dependent LLM class oxidoreductase [Anaerolineae bacterium]PWB53254.1 MAG: LLM class F420-dependent oxidoreductase [Anaerolineales bacterium]